MCGVRENDQWSGYWVVHGYLAWYLCDDRIFLKKNLTHFLFSRFYLGGSCRDAVLRSMILWGVLLW